MLSEWRINMSNVVFVQELDFYEDVLDWSCKYDLRTELVDFAWDQLRNCFDYGDQAWDHLDRFAGELYETIIELDGPTIRVKIIGVDDVTEFLDDIDKNKLARHTPGPWSINDWPQGDSEIRIGADGTSRIATVHLRDVSINEQYANAKLIASVPTLLKRVEELEAKNKWYANELEQLRILIKQTV
jgi:hypothetical protein